MKRSALCVVPLLLLPAIARADVAATAARSEVSPDQPALFGPDDLVLLEVVSGNITLSEALGGYHGRTGTYLPLGELARLLDLAIVVVPPERRATGWVLKEDRTFSLDLNAGTARSGSTEIKLSSTDAVMRDNEIYVRAEILARLIPADFKADLGGLQLSIVAHDMFPFQARLERERRASGIGPDRFDARGAPVAQPYGLFTPPALDVTLDGAIGNHSPRRQTRYDVRVAGDLLYSDAQFYLGSDQNGNPTNARVLLERKDPDGKLAGPFGITRSSLGDTYTPSLSVGAGSQGGRGFAVSSEPLEQASVFNRIDLRGELPLGYQIELYVNEVLRGSQTQPVEGRYEFLQIPLVYGVNVIRLVLYGPRGERREEVRRVNIGGGQLAKGAFTFAVGAVQQGLPVIQLADPAAGLPSFDPGQNRLRAVGRAAYGLTADITLVGGLAAYTPTQGNSRLLTTIGARTGLAGFASQLDLAADNRGGSAVALGLAGRPLGISVVARHGEYRGGFVDEALPRGGGSTIALRRSTDVEADTSLHFGTRVIPIAFQIDRNEQVDGRVLIDAVGRMSLPVARYLVSNAVSLQQERGAGRPAITRASGTTDISALIATRWQVRASLSYDIAPGTTIRQAVATVDRLVSDAVSVRFAAAHSFGSPSTTSLQGGVTVRFPWADLAANTTYETGSRDARVGLQLTFGALFDPMRRRYRLARPGVASGGSFALMAYADRDGDGTFGPGDEPLPGIKLRSGGRPVETGNDGTAIVTGLGDGTRARIEVDASGLDDPYLTAGGGVYAMVPRPGHVATMALPFAPSGEVTLRLMFDDGKTKRGLSALAVQLLGEDGRVVAAGRSEFDGALLLDGLKPGRYRVNLDPAQAERLHFILSDTVDIMIPRTGGYVGEVSAIVRHSSP